MKYIFDCVNLRKLDEALGWVYPIVAMCATMLFIKR